MKGLIYFICIFICTFLGGGGRTRPELQAVGVLFVFFFNENNYIYGFIMLLFFLLMIFRSDLFALFCFRVFSFRYIFNRLLE